MPGGGYFGSPLRHGRQAGRHVDYFALSGGQPCPCWWAVAVPKHIFISVRVCACVRSFKLTHCFSLSLSHFYLLFEHIYCFRFLSVATFLLGETVGERERERERPGSNMAGTQDGVIVFGNYAFI